MAADTAAANEAHFNNIGADYDLRYKVAVEQLDKLLKEHKDFIGVPQGGRLLDYACGTGLLSRALGSGLGQCVGVDVAEGMVNAYNDRSKREGYTEEQRFAVTANLLLPSPSPALSSPAFFNFDIAAVGAAMHHFDDAHLAAQRIAERLRPGGVLFVLDFLAHEPDAKTEDGHAQRVKHHGFTEAEVRAVFDGAGVGRGFGCLDIGEVVFRKGEAGEEDMKRRIFLARGEKT